MERMIAFIEKMQSVGFNLGHRRCRRGFTRSPRRQRRNEARGLEIGSQTHTYLLLCENPRDTSKRAEIFASNTMVRRTNQAAQAWRCQSGYGAIA